MSNDPIPIVGVSLGHRHQRTGISVIEHAYVPTGELFNAVTYDERGWQRLQTEEHLSVEYRVRHLERQGPPSRYKKVVRRLPEIVREIGRDVLLVLDITTAGHPVYALIWSELAKGVPKESRIHTTFCPVTVSGIAGGVSKSPDAGYLVPRRDLISGTQILFDEGQLKIAEGLSLASTLTEELTAFKPKAETKPDDLEGWRERPHDDLVLAVATSVWAAERFLRKRESKPVDLIGTGPTRT